MASLHDHNVSDEHRHLVQRQHIQDHAMAQEIRPYWGYADRILPCTNDKGTCEYLESVYSMHEISMQYTFIMWIVIGVILVLFLLARVIKSQRSGADARSGKQSSVHRAWKSMVARWRQFMLPESGLFGMFPNTTRLQVVILGVLCAYLIVFSLVGITYKTWVTPIKDSDKSNTRSGLGGFADRVGALAYALTPLTIALCSRDSVLSLITGIPYLHFNFLHRWTGRIILVQSLMHATGWTIIEAKLYQPQPKVYNKFIKQPYMIWGIVAQTLLCFLFVFSLRSVIRITGYEFFRKSHLLVAGVYLGACWGHWDKLACWMIASLILMGIDLGMRVIRMALIHVGYNKDGGGGIGFRAITSKVDVFEDPSGTVLRLSFDARHKPWKIGQHFYLTFPALSIWQSHPFTVASVPPTSPSTDASHVYVIRARNGETGRLAGLGNSRAVNTPTFNHEKSHQNPTIARSFETPVIVVGPYGGSVVDPEVPNLLTIAGGTGISFTMPVVMAALNDPSPAAAQKNIELVWIVRHIQNLAWLAPEVAALRRHLDDSSSPPSSSSSSSPALEFGSDMTNKEYGPDVINKEFGSDMIYQMTEKRIPMVTTSIPRASARFRITIIVTRGISSDENNQPASVRDLIAPHPNFTLTYLDHTQPSVTGMLDAFMNDTVAGGRVRVIASGPPALGTDVRASVAAKNATGDVECVWDDRQG